MPLCKEARIEKFFDPLNAAMEEFQINTAKRQAMFLAQIAHESGELRYVEEIASGEDYEFRDDLGNDQPGDGVRFKGRGLIQITGRDNYRACGSALGVDLLSTPERLEEPDLACRSAAWFWQSRRLNELADLGTQDAFNKITRRINGGFNGMGQRLTYWNRARRVLGLQAEEVN